VATEVIAKLTFEQETKNCIKYVATDALVLKSPVYITKRCLGIPPYPDQILIVVKA